MHSCRNYPLMAIREGDTHTHPALCPRETNVEHSLVGDRASSWGFPVRDMRDAAQWRQQCGLRAAVAMARATQCLFQTSFNRRRVLAGSKPHAGAQRESREPTTCSWLLSLLPVTLSNAGSTAGTRGASEPGQSSSAKSAFLLKTYFGRPIQKYIVLSKN